MDEKIGRAVTRVVLPRVVMHSRHHYAVFPREIFCMISLSVFNLHICSVLNQKLQFKEWLMSDLLQAFSGNFTGLELEDGGESGTSGFNFITFLY